MVETINVEKLGSNLVANGAGVDYGRLFEFAAGFVARYDLQGVRHANGLVITTSGAAATGKCIANELGYAVEGLSPEQLSGMGFAPTFAGWQTVFGELGVAVATTGVTHHQLGGGRIWHRLANRQEKKLFVSCIRANMDAGVVTVVNEPDMISNAELMKLATGGDNDGLGGRIADVIAADSYVIRTKKGGVYDDSGELVDQVDATNIDAVLKMLRGRTKSGPGRGGMDTKVAAAWKAARLGVGSVAISAISDDMSLINMTQFIA